MTSTNAARSGDVDAPTRSPPQSKSLLFCPACDFRAPVDGPWRIGDDVRQRAIHCPRCSARVS